MNAATNDGRGVRRPRLALRAVLAAAAVLGASIVATAPAQATTATLTGSVSSPSNPPTSPKTAVQTITLTSAGTVQASLDWSDAAANLTLNLKGPAGTVVASSATRNKPETLTYQAPAAGTYKFNIIAASGSTAYTLTTSYPGERPTDPGALATYDESFGFKGPAGLYAYGMDWDSSDDSILVGDYWNYRVKRFTSAGYTPGGGVGGKVVSTQKPAGVLGGTAAPYDVESDQFDRINGRATWWSADQESSRIVQFDHDGRWLQTIGRGGGGTDASRPGAAYPAGCGGGMMDIPTHIYVDPANGQIYVSDPRCRMVYRFSHTGDFLGQFDFAPFIKATGIFSPIPRGLAGGPDGNVYVAEFQSRSVLVFDKQGNYLRKFAKQSDMNDPRGIDIDPRNGDVVVVAGYFNDIFKFSASGTLIKKWGTVDGTPTGRQFDAIRFPAVDGDGNIYVGETWGTRAPDGSYTGYEVYKFTSDGSPLPWATGSGPPPDGGFNQVNGIALDGQDDLFAVDTFEQRVQAFATGAGQSCRSATSCGAWQLQFGSREPAGTQSKGFGYPRALTYGAERDLIYVGDNNNAVLAWTPDGQFVHRFGQQGKGVGQFSGGVQGIRAQDGVIFTTDVANCRLSLWDEAGSLGNNFGTLLMSMGSCGSGANQMGAPRGIAVGPGSTVYVAETANSRISRWDTASRTAVSYKPRCGGVNIKTPWGITWNPERTWLYIGDVGNKRVVRMSPDGTTCQVVTTGLDTPQGAFGGADYLEFDSSGRLYISDNNKTVYRFTVTD